MSQAGYLKQEEAGRWTLGLILSLWLLFEGLTSARTRELGSGRRRYKWGTLGKLLAMA